MSTHEKADRAKANGLTLPPLRFKQQTMKIDFTLPKVRKGSFWQMIMGSRFAAAVRKLD